MMSFYSGCLRPLLFRADAEQVHHATLRACQIVGALSPVRTMMESVFAFSDGRLQTCVAGIDFDNPIGLAAGFDKNGIGYDALSALGFGLIEIGSISARASRGNQDCVRLLRLPADEALLVNYGVPNDGADAVSCRLPLKKRRVPLGVSVVETNTGFTSHVDAVIAELTEAAGYFVGRCDYLVINLNCPNSSDGKSYFDESDNLMRLLQSYRQIAHLPPVFLKIMPCAVDARIDAVLEAVSPFDFVHGFILNALADKPYHNLKTPNDVLKVMPGTLTGQPLRVPANVAVCNWYRRIDRRRHKLVGVGGITTGADAYEIIRLGASLVQILTSLIYQGPFLVKKIKKELAELLARDGVKSITDIVGVDNAALHL